MNRLLGFDGGQQLQAEDWVFIQDATEDTIKAIIKGLGATAPVIVSGMVVTIADGNVTVTEGYLFKDDEIFYVPAAIFVDLGESYTLNLAPNITTGEARTFKDTSTHNVYQYRRYIAGYSSSFVAGTIPFPASNILGLITQHVLGFVPVTPVQYVKYRTVIFAASALDQPVTLIPAPGLSQAILVSSIAAKITPTSTLDVGEQELDIFYGTDNTEVGVGIIPNAFLTSTTQTLYRMDPIDQAMYKNQPISAQLSGEEAPSSGIASIQFYCYYIVITL
jgi:hypothetical protein